METVKKLIYDFSYKLVFTFCTLLLSVITYAQDTKKVDVNIGSKGGGGFFASPIVWVVGAAVFVLLLVALLRGGGKKD